MSHEFRTPLNSIRALTGLLLDCVDGALSHEQERQVTLIRKATDDLSNLVEDLLDLGRIEAGELRADLDVFELDDLTSRTIDRFAERMRGHDLRVAVATVPVLVDPVFLDEALTNLLDNALKFTPNGSTIRVAAAPTDTSPVHLVVEDSGAGVPPDLLPRVFEKFFRAPGPSARGRPGTGIGLAVVRGLVEAMGGSVSARASDLGGLAVELQLPLAELPAELSHPAEAHVA
jgi:signal transduction histidine kinase